MVSKFDLAQRRTGMAEEQLRITTRELRQVREDLRNANAKLVDAIGAKRKLSADLDKVRFESSVLRGEIQDLREDLRIYEQGSLNVIKFLRVAAPAVYARYYDEKRQQLNTTKMGADADLVNAYNDTTEILNFIEDNPWNAEGAS